VAGGAVRGLLDDPPNATLVTDPGIG